MNGIRFLAVLAFLAGPVVAGPDGKTGAKKPQTPPPVKTALNKAFKGRIVKIKKRKVTLFYDFEDPAQLEDFEGVRPPRLLNRKQNRFRISGGRLVLEGSTAIRHKMEGQGELRARFFVKVSQQHNVGI